MKKMEYFVQETFAAVTMQQRKQKIQQLMETYLHSVMQQIVHGNEGEGQGQP